jgi:hypothetical protein
MAWMSRGMIIMKFISGVDLEVLQGILNHSAVNLSADMTTNLQWHVSVAFRKQSAYPIANSSSSRAKKSAFPLPFRNQFGQNFSCSTS